MEYINFPVLANFYLFEGFAVKVGLQPAVKLRAYAKAGGEALSMDDINTLDIAIPAEVDITALSEEEQLVSDTQLIKAIEVVQTMK